MTDTETPTTIEPTTLESQHLRALRNADRIVFRTYEGRSTVEAIRDGRNTPSGFEDTVTVDAGETFTDYGASHSSQSADGYSAFHMEHSAQHAPVLRTVLRHLRPGDTLTLHWVRDNNSETHRDTGLHADELRLIVRTRKGTGPLDEYLIESAVRLDNSARLVRRV